MTTDTLPTARRRPTPAARSNDAAPPSGPLARLGPIRIHLADETSRPMTTRVPHDDDLDAKLRSATARVRRRRLAQLDADYERGLLFIIGGCVVHGVHDVLGESERATRVLLGSLEQIAEIYAHGYLTEAEAVEFRAWLRQPLATDAPRTLTEELRADLREVLVAAGLLDEEEGA